MCCGLFILNFHFYVVCYLCIKCKSHLIEKKKPENNRNYTSGCQGISEGVGWEHLPKMGQSLTWFMKCRGSFGGLLWTMQTNLMAFCGLVWIFLGHLLWKLLHFVHCQSVNRVFFVI